jgi:PAS domain S-box-containing protein
MGINRKTKAELLKELQEMRAIAQEIDKCREDVEKIQRRYRELLDSAPDAIVFVDTRARIVMTNATFERLFGYTNMEVVGRKLDMLIPERFRARHNDFVNRFIVEPRPRPMGTGLEIYAMKKSGEEFPADISLNLLHTDEEILVSAAVRDITERKREEQQLELDYYIQKVVNSMLGISLESIPLEEKFDRILKLIVSVPYMSLQSRGAIYLLDDKGEKLVLRARSGFRDDEDMPCREVPMGKCMCGRAAEKAETEFAGYPDERHEIHDRGAFPHGHFCVPIVSGDETLGILNVFIKEGHKRSSREEAFMTSVAGTLAGIITRHRTEEEKKRLQAMLAQSEKLAALGRFTANVAHEIRNPLTSVGGFARRLKGRITGDGKQKEYVEFIIAEVSRLENILKNVLSFSREIVPRYEEHDIHEIIERVLMMNDDLFREKSIEVRKEYADLPAILIDADQFLEVLENIVLNAVDAMPEGGFLNVSTGESESSAGRFVSVRIDDTGMGIPEDKMDMIFEPFFTTKISEKGTGLGLSITKKIMETLRGSVDISSVEGKWTSVTLKIPMRTSDQ